MSSRLRSRIRWDATETGSRSRPALARLDQPPSYAPACSLDVPSAPRDEAIALMHVGAEVEHALMVQYLYGAYSLNLDQPDEAKRTLVSSWRGLIVQIAREEMGHLATVQNMLTLIGGPLCFEREDYPIIDEELWPFPFELEPLTKTSLGKYVLAESPSDDTLEKLGLRAEIQAIRERVGHSASLSVNRVGLIYDRITTLFTAGPMVQGPVNPSDLHPFIATVDIQAASLPYQADASAWGLGQTDILIETAKDRTTALNAIALVAQQGEGSSMPDELMDSHFGKFLSIYRNFPEPGDWSPSRNAASNPTTNQRVKDPARRIAGEAEPWAVLANQRYRMLLAFLQHSFHVEGLEGANSPRGALISWAFGEMYNLRSLSEILMAMPLAPGSSLRAGPPFEMPYTLSLPVRNVDRWRTHRDNLTASIDLVDRMIGAGAGNERYLRALRTADQNSLRQVTALVGA